ncbi:solute carrier family 22 member 18-like isoform X2 [Dysidea avara]|uniref:solute carrier family 22 member 18-like isoform X2 n=1 Tax=Dysidea avara TaxID=196820 RepID=UPI00332F6EA9
MSGFYGKDVYITTKRFLSKKLGVDPIMFGYLETIFSISMLIGGPLFGRFGDLFGARAALTLALFSAFLTYAMLAMSSNILMLFLSRLPGVLMHVMHGAQMVVTDVSGSAERVDVLGKLGVAYGVGMVTGPTVGGLITRFSSEQTAALAASIISLATIVLVLATVPKTTKDPGRVAKTDEAKSESHSVFDYQAILALLKIPMVRYIVILKVVVGIPVGVFHSMFAMVNIDKFGLTAETNGHLLSYVGIVTMVMQGFGVGYISKRFSDGSLLKMSTAALAVSYLLLALVDNLPFLLVILIPMIASGSLLNLVASSSITKCVPDTATGTSLGLSMATHSLIRTMTPTLGGYLYALFGYPSFGLLGFVMNGAMMISILMGYTGGIK